MANVNRDIPTTATHQSFYSLIFPALVHPAIIKHGSQTTPPKLASWLGQNLEAHHVGERETRPTGGQKPEAQPAT
jgi:hypothetical protein